MQYWSRWLYGDPYWLHWSTASRPPLNDLLALTFEDFPPISTDHNQQDSQNSAAPSANLFFLLQEVYMSIQSSISVLFIAHFNRVRQPRNWNWNPWELSSNSKIQLLSTSSMKHNHGMRIRPVKDGGLRRLLEVGTNTDEANNQKDGPSTWHSRKLFRDGDDYWTSFLISRPYCCGRWSRKREEEQKLKLVT